MSLNNLDKLLKINSLKKLGLLIDIGNIRANGYDIEEYLKKFPNKIFEFISNRDRFFGKVKYYQRIFMS